MLIQINHFSIAAAMMVKAYKPKLFLFVVLLSTCFNSFSQTIRYSRKTLKQPTYDGMQLIPNVSGKYHLLFFKRNKALSVYSFDHDLQLLSKKELPIKYIDSCDIKILPFKNFYLLYRHKQRSTSHELWKIDAEGEVSSLSDLFQNLIDSAFTKSTATLQLINNNERLVVLANTYYGELKLLATNMVKVDENFKTISSYNFSYPFEQGPNILNQTMLIREHLYILKSTRHSKDYALEVIKADLNTGKLFRKAFISKDNFTRNAAFQYITADSSILVYSTTTSQVFISKLDLSLKELGSPTLLVPQLSNNVPYNYLLVEGGVQHWLSISLINTRFRSQSNSDYYIPPPINDWRSSYWYSNRNLIWQDYNIQRFSSNGYGSGTYLPGQVYRVSGYTVDDFNPPIRFSVVDNDFHLVHDSIVKNEKSFSKLRGSQYVSLMSGRKSYLILKQDLPRKRKGLLLVSVDNGNQISTKDITVYSKYEYLLQHAQTMKDETLVMPFLKNMEIGLVKLSFANMER